MERKPAGGWSEGPANVCPHYQQSIAITQEPGTSRAAWRLCWCLGGTRAWESSTHHLGSCLQVLTRKGCNWEVAWSMHAVVGWTLLWGLQRPQAALYRCGCMAVWLGSSCFFTFTMAEL